MLLLPTYTFFSFEKMKSGFCGRADSDGRDNLTVWLLEFPLPLLVLAILSMMFMFFMEKFCGCLCLGETCCNISDWTRVYDPDQEDAQYQDSLEME